MKCLKMQEELASEGGNEIDIASEELIGSIHPILA